MFKSLIHLAMGWGASLVIQQGWLWHWITLEGWYAIKQRNRNQTAVLIISKDEFKWCFNKWRTCWNKFVEFQRVCLRENQRFIHLLTDGSLQFQQRRKFDAVLKKKIIFYFILRRLSSDVDLCVKDTRRTIDVHFTSTGSKRESSYLRSYVISRLLRV